jgi:uncharacterized protein (TIGR03085 family)
MSDQAEPAVGGAEPEAGAATAAGAPLDAVERDQLCDLFLELGPEAPTLCEGWSTLDLAAHLVMREHDPRSGLAILGGDRFAKLEDRLMSKTRAKGYETLVERLRSGPPLVPWRMPGLRTLLNLNEWFVHHEDVRRANGQPPRSDRPDLDDALWDLTGRTARMAVRGLKGAGLEIDAPGHGHRTLKKAQPVVTLTGGPQELVLFVNGRRDAAQVELAGDQAGLEALAAARLGI